MKHEKIEQMKQDYEKIEVPEELKERLVDSMERAKLENRQAKRNNKWIRGIGGGAVAAVLAVTLLCNTSEGAAKAFGRIPVLGSITNVLTVRNYEDTQGGFDINIKIPMLEGDSEEIKEINRQIEVYNNEIIKAYQADLQEVFESDEFTVEEFRESVSTDYEVVTDNDRVFTLRINTTISRGGSVEFSKVYNIDKRDGKIVELKDLFQENADYVTVLSTEVIKQMKAASASDESKIYFLDDEMKDKFETINAEQNFYLNENGQLVLVFDEYEVAPGYMGMQEFVIDTDVISDLISVNSLLNK